MNKIKTFLIEEVIALDSFFLSLFGNDRTTLSQVIAMLFI